MMKTAQPKSQEGTDSWSSKSKDGSFFLFNQPKMSPFFGPAAIQPKLKIGEPDDAYEKQADRVADAVVQMKDSEVQRQPIEEEEELQMQREPVLQRKCKECEEEKKVQKKTHDSSGPEKATGEKMSRQLQTSRGSGNRLPEKIESEMSRRIGADFSSVNIHTGSNAVQMNRSLGARAFTYGKDIYFNSGEYNPSTSDGQHLLAHELTHVVQQSNKKIAPNVQRTIGDGHDLASPRMSGNTLFEAVFDNEEVIENGDSGQEVRRIQQMLIDLGIPMPAFGADGEFGAETKQAVKTFQRAHPPLTPDGRVGFATIEALDNEFPAFALPADRSDPWTMNCILEILCPWNRNLVENILPSFTVKTFDSREFPVETWNGSSWDTSTFTSGGFRSGSTNTIGLLNSTTCEEMAFTIYHEGWHAQKPSSLAGVVEIELDAYVNAEQWSIDVGIPGQGTFTNEATGTSENFRTTQGGETVVNEPAAETFVRQEYGGVSSNPGEIILSRVGASDVRVRRADASEYVRPAQVGESVKGAAVMTNLRTIDPANWNCP